MSLSWALSLVKVDYLQFILLLGCVPIRSQLKAGKCTNYSLLWHPVIYIKKKNLPRSLRLFKANLTSLKPILKYIVSWREENTIISEILSLGILSLLDMNQVNSVSLEILPIYFKEMYAHTHIQFIQFSLVFRERCL